MSRDEAGLQQVVHFMSDPASPGRRRKATIDLGSAPVEALEDLLFAAVRRWSRSTSARMILTYEKSAASCGFAAMHGAGSLESDRDQIWQSPCTD